LAWRALNGPKKRRFPARAVERDHSREIGQGADDVLFDHGASRAD
jgi:hypothetical protein